MQVPVYNRQFVEPEALPGPSLDPRGTPNPLGDLGAGFGAMARAANAIVERERREDDVFRAEAQINKLNDALADLTHGQDGALNVRGENVFKLGEPLTAAYQKKYDEIARQLETELSTDEQKRRYRVVAGRLRGQFTRQLGTHEAAEGRAFRKSTFEGIVASELDAAGRALDTPDAEGADEQIRFSIGRATQNARQYYTRELGLNKEQVEGEVLKLESQIHKRVIDRYLEAENPAAAKSYYETHKERITVDDGARARTQIEKDGRGALVNREAERIWSELGPRRDDDPVNLDVMERAANKAFEQDADGRKLLIAELRQRREAHDYSANERQNAVIGGIWNQVIDGRPLAAIRRSPEFRALDGKSQAGLTTEIERYQKRNENDPATQIEKFKRFWEVASDPERLRRMSDAEIFTMTPSMGFDLVKQTLAKKQQLLNQDEKVIEATLDEDSLKYLAREAGINPDMDKNKPLMGELRYRAEQIIDLEQRNRGNKKLSRTERDEVIKGLVRKIPSTSRPWYALGFERTTESPLIQIPAENIPKSDRDEIVRILQNAGIADPTDAQIREGYIVRRMR